MSERDAIGLALLYAYVREQREAADFLLEQDGNWNMTGVNNGAVLHRAAILGDLDMVKRLVAKGADIGNRDNPFMTTPLGWAHHGSQAAVVEWLRANCAIDIHDAVQYGFREHVEARLREDPLQVNLQRDHAELPRCAPLHCAAFMNRPDMATLLLERGADPNLLAGNGWTPLDLADLEGATAAAAVLEQHGGTRTHEAAKPSSHPGLKDFEKLASDIAQAYRTDDAEPLQRIQQFFNRRVTFHDVRTGARSRLQKDRDFSGDISLAEARDVVAGLRGFTSWSALAESVTRRDGGATSWGRPAYIIDQAESRIELRHGLDDADWDAIIAVIAERKIRRIDANGQLTDTVMERLTALDHITHLDASNSKRLTDAGVRRVSALRRLEYLNVSNAGITDAGLDVLRELPDLKAFNLEWDSHLSDGGVANLAFCDGLEEVNLMGSRLGDGVINALTAKRELRRVTTGLLLTDAAMPLFHRFPAFTKWSGRTPQYSLMSFRDDHTNLMLDGPITNQGLKHLAGLEGLSGLGFFWHALAITPDGLAALIDLPNVGLLGCGGELCTDVAMQHIARMPKLRMLQAQGTVATDAGFEALSRSQTLEYIWGRECPNLTGRGFAALANLPALRGLGVSCKNVDVSSLALLPRFRALGDFMPMDVEDEGFRHVGKCENLERLWCMYCRDTTDVATAHIAGLRKLKTYYAGQTKITDRSLEILADMPSLERVEFWNCAGITNGGLAGLAALPNLRELIAGGCRQVTADAATAFAPTVRVKIST
jgi:ankyrin repeat protein